jgi:N-methylhydantoinase A
MVYRLGIDIGGTFTDLSLYEQSSGRLFGHKVPTTPSNPASGVLDGLDELLGLAGGEVRDIQSLVHGTTIGLNTLLQRSGAELALFVTEGFRDVLEIQRLRLSDPVNFNATRPAPLIPRWRVFEIRERILTDGSIDAPLDRSSVETAVDAARSRGVEGIVVCLVNSYRNDEHEQAIKAIIAELAPELDVCCSCEVWPQIREYERAIVAVINAYIRPRVSGYLDSLVDALEEKGLSTTPYITKSNGGVMTARSARDRTVETLLSGPASGVVGAIRAAEKSGYRDLLTFDMGGTSADIAVVLEGEPVYTYDAHVGDFPVVVPSIGVSSIGAGGGSIAWFDRSGLLKVGPRSAGAEPGPACYAKGGTEPTLTDAFVVCGLIDPGHFAGGRITLDRERATNAVSVIATRLNLTVEDAAEAIIDVSTANMYAEFSQTLARHGLDPRDFTLVAFGGAGPLAACFLAAEFHIPRVLVPRAPGMLCAEGALNADLKNDYIRTLNVRLDPSSTSEIRSAFAVLARQGASWLGNQAGELVDHRMAYSAEMRYRHQAYEVQVPIDPRWLDDASGQQLADAFHRQHERLFAHADPSEAVELASARVQAIGRVPGASVPGLEPSVSSATPYTSRMIRYGGQSRLADVFQRTDLRADQTIEGPAIIEQQDTTTLVPAHFSAGVDRSGNLTITDESETVKQPVPLLTDERLAIA